MEESRTKKPRILESQEELVGSSLHADSSPTAIPVEDTDIAKWAWDRVDCDLILFDSDNEGVNPAGERDLKSAVLYRKAQRLQVIRAFGLLSHQRLQEDGVQDLPGPLETKKVLRCAVVKFACSYFADDRIRALLTLGAVHSSLYLDKRVHETFHPLGSAPPTLEDVGDTFEHFLTAIEYLGGWDAAVLLENKYRTNE
jgi:hypothetical protein